MLIFQIPYLTSATKRAKQSTVVGCFLIFIWRFAVFIHHFLDFIRHFTVSIRHFLDFIRHFTVSIHHFLDFIRHFAVFIHHFLDFIRHFTVSIRLIFIYPKLQEVLPTIKKAFIDRHYA
ncbi:hypothetical protein ACOMCU_03855, partial [Lysinibacillus sp. UGB7]|uniref:hypothetical protein n=1 Tax=Lysinibacillus sp. UGB7 TaxID=3411039 RepID=UPI003B78E55A